MRNFFNKFGKKMFSQNWPIQQVDPLTVEEWQALDPSEGMETEVVGIGKVRYENEVWVTITNSATKGKVLQVVHASTTTPVSVTSSTYTDTTLTATITPRSQTSKIYVRISQSFNVQSPNLAQGLALKLLRDASTLITLDRGGNFDGAGLIFAAPDSNPLLILGGYFTFNFPDTPTIPNPPVAMVYKTQIRPKQTGSGYSANVQSQNSPSYIELWEVEPND